MITDATAANRYTGNGSTTVFAYSERITVKTDLEVLVNLVVKTVDTDYTVSGVDNPSGGNVTFGTAPANGFSVVILRKQPFEQASNYVANEDFPAERIEKDLDKLAMIAQQLREMMGRALKFSKQSTLTDKDVPDLTASKYLRVNGAGTDWELVSSVDIGGTLTVPAFTAGSVVFASASSTVAQDNANLFWDDSNNRLGIGTATPSTTVHVVGTATITGAVSVGSGSTVGADPSADLGIATKQYADVGRLLAFLNGG